MSNTMETYDIEGSDVAEEERRLLQVAGRADEQSLWNTTKRGILKRKTKWIQRFASGLTEDNIKPPVLTYHEKRLLLMKASGWEPLEVVLPELPMAPDLTRIEDVDRFPTRLHSTTLCAKCWKSVPVGVERVCCVICDVVCHRGCIADVAPFVSKRKVMGEEIKSSKGKSKGKSISSSRTPDKKLDAPLASAVQTPMSTSLPVTVTAPTTTTTAKSEKALSLSAQKLFNDIDNGKNVKIHDPSAELYANVRKVLSSAQNISRTASGTLGGVVLRGEHGMSESRVNDSVGTDRAPSQNKASTGSSFVSPAPGNRTKSMDQYNDIVNAINIVNMAEKQNYGVNTCNDKQMQTECVETDLTACALEWHCPFCVDSVNAYNKKLQVRYEKSAHQWNMLRATLHLQSFVRMVAPRIQFLTARAGVIRAQRKFRSRIFWLKMASDTINVPRPVRFKVHDMLIVFKTTDTPIANPPRDIGHEKGLVGQMMSSVFPAYAQYESNGRELPEQHKAMMALLKGDSAGSGGSTVGSAVATASGDIPLYAATFNKAASVPRGDLFVTVAITETRPEGAENRVAKQYYRFDIPLRQDGKPVRLTPNRLEIMGCSNFGDLTKNDLQIISENYRIIPFSLPRPYILLPSCVRNSTIKLTLSEMYEWPKAVCCGQAMEPLNNYLMWKKMASFRQGLRKCQWSDLPTPDESSKLNVLQKIKGLAVPGESNKPSGAGAGSSALSLAPIKDASMTTSPIDGVPLPDIAPDAISIADASVATNTKSVKSSSTLSKKIVGRSARKTDKGAFILNESSSSSSVREYAGGTIAWSVLSVSYDALDYAGFLYFLVMANIHSAKKRFWCVLLDGILMTFSSVTDLKAKETIDLRYCYVNCLADGVIELQYVKESPQKIWYYVHCANRKEFSNWTRKFNELGYSKTVRNGSPENGSRAVSPTHENGSRPASPTRDVREMDGSRPASPTRDVREMDIVTGSVVPVRLPDPLSRHGTPRHDSSDRASSVNSTPAKDTPFEKPQLQRASSIMSRHKNRNSLHNRMQHVI